MATKGEDEKPLNCVFYDKRSREIGIATDHGYKIFWLIDKYRIIQTYNYTLKEVCVLGSQGSFTDRVAIVRSDTPHKLEICNIGKVFESERNRSILFPKKILSVKSTEYTWITCLEDHIYFHNTSDLRELHALGLPQHNTRGLFCSTRRCGYNYVAYPEDGKVHIIDTSNQFQKHITINAYEGCSLVAMAFDENGHLIATASDKGMIIKVFQVSDGTLVRKFLSSIARNATIYDLAFSPNSKYLACSSDTETVHIFSIRPLPTSGQDSANGWLSSAVQSSVDYMSSPITGGILQERSFATATLPFPGRKTLLSLTVIFNDDEFPGDGIWHFVIISYDGFVYIYEFDSKEGGECRLLNQLQLHIPPGRLEKDEEFEVYDTDFDNDNDTDTEDFVHGSTVRKF